MRKKHSVPRTTSALHLLIPGMTSILISQRFPAIMRHHRRAVCGSLSANEIRMFLRPCWPPRSSILSFARALHSSCLFISSLDQEPPWVGGNGWIMSYLTLASWGCYSELVFFRPLFHPAAYPNFRASSTSVTWSVGGVPPPIPFSSLAVRSPWP